MRRTYPAFGIRVAGIVAAVASLVITQNALAQGARAGPNLSGLWELRFDSGNVPPASLTSAMAAEDPAFNMSTT